MPAELAEARRAIGIVVQPLCEVTVVGVVPVAGQCHRDADDEVHFVRVRETVGTPDAVDEPLARLVGAQTLEERVDLRGRSIRHDEAERLSGLVEDVHTTLGAVVGAKPLRERAHESEADAVAVTDREALERLVIDRDDGETLELVVDEGLRFVEHEIAIGLKPSDREPRLIGRRGESIGRLHFDFVLGRLGALHLARDDATTRPSSARGCRRRPATTTYNRRDRRVVRT